MSEVTLTFNKQDLSTLNMALLEVPTKYGAPLIQKINQQIQQHFDSSIDAKNMSNGHSPPRDLNTGD